MPTFPNDFSAGAHFAFGRPSPTRIPSESRETVRVAVRSTLNGAAVDPSAGEVSFAFVERGVTPAAADFVAGNWEALASGWLATCLLGPGGVQELIPGLYRVWVTVADDPEVPVRDVGDLGVY